MSTKKATVKFSNGNHTIEGCGMNKTAAKKKQAKIKADGYTSRIIKKGTKNCVTKGPKSKVKCRKKTTRKTTRRTTRRKCA